MRAHGECEMMEVYMNFELGPIRHMYFRMALCYARSYDGFLIITLFLCSSLGLAASVGHTLIMQVSINRFVVIECNARQWRPPVSRVGDVECVAFHPHDKNLINIVASMGGH